MPAIAVDLARRNPLIEMGLDFKVTKLLLSFLTMSGSRNANGETEIANY